MLLQNILFFSLCPIIIYVFVRIERDYESDIEKRKTLNAFVPLWSTAEATVVESEVREGTLGGPPDPDIYTYFHIKYVFSVNGKKHYSTILKFLDSIGHTEERCRALVNQYPVGLKVEVHYNPENLSECCLLQSDDHDLRNESRAKIAFIIFFMGIGSIFTYIFLSYDWISRLIAIITWIIIFSVVLSNHLQKRDSGMT
jgi:hypothetical protein